VGKLSTFLSCKMLFILSSPRAVDNWSVNCLLSAAPIFVESWGIQTKHTATARLSLLSNPACLNTRDCSEWKALLNQT